MKTFRTAFLLFSVSVFLLSAASFASSVGRNLMTVGAAQAVSAPEPAYYVVKELDGCIGIYAADSQEPLRVVHISVADLPEEDRYLLGCGMVVRGNTELRELIEDYTS